MRQKKRLRLRLVLYVVLTAGLLFVAVFGEAIAPHDPYETDFMAIDTPPNREFWLGTDNLGRCMFSRILAGAGSSLLATAAIVLATALIGTALGVAAGYWGGCVDAVIQKFLLIIQSFPGQVMSIAVAGVLGAGLRNAVLALVSIGWVTYARMSRSAVMKIRNANFIRAARLCGQSAPEIILWHVLPNIRNILLITMMTALSTTMLLLSGLSFLGLSSKPPYPEWGFMMNEGRKVLMTAPWQALAPGLAIFVTVVILNRLGDSARDYLEFMRDYNG